MTPSTSSRPSVLQVGAGWFPEAPGGAERVYYELIRHLPQAGFDVDGLVLAKATPSAGPGADIRAYARPDARLASRMLALRWATKSHVRARRPSLLACHNALYGFSIVDMLSSLPTVFHFHGPRAAEGLVERTGVPAWLAWRCIEQILFRRVSKFVVLSRAFRDVLIQTYRVPAERIAVIPGGVDVARFECGLDKTAARQALGIPTDRPIVLAVRRLVRRMGLENLIEAFGDVACSFPEALLIIAGSGPLRAELEQQITSQGLDRNVRLLGRIPDAQLPLLYRAADISIVPSLTLEGFGLTTVESLACGTPVLVTPVGGLPEVVADLSPSLILGGSGPGILAEGLMKFLSGTLPVPEARTCASYAQQRFDWPIIAARTADLYSSMLARGAQAAPRHSAQAAPESMEQV